MGSAEAGRRVPAFGAVESVGDGSSAATDGVGALDDVEERVGVFVQEGVQESHGLSTLREASLVEETDEACERRRRRGGAADTLGAAMLVHLEALTERRHIRRGSALRRKRIRRRQLRCVLEVGRHVVALPCRVGALAKLGAEAAPLPNWSVAISSLPTCWPTKRVAPTAVTHGDDAGHEGHRTTFRLGPRPDPPDVEPGSEEVPVTLLKMVQLPSRRLGLVPLEVPGSEE